MPRTGRPPHDLPIDRIRELASQQMTTSEIAREIGSSQKAVWGAMRRNGIQRLPQKARREKNYFWSGGRTNALGYILIHKPDHPNANKHGYIQEHRLVMEQVLGRYLTRTEVVDHIDGDKANNASENLRLFASNADHLRVTLKGRVPNWSEEGRERIVQAARKPRRRHATDESSSTH